MTYLDTKCSHRGFTLIELMISVVIVAILAAFAYPNYQEYVMRGRRIDAKNALLALQVAQEKRFLISNSYITSTADVSKAMNAGGLGIKTTTENGFYDISIAGGATATTYTAIASPRGAQAHDKCGKLTIDNTGTKGVILPPKGIDDKCW